MDKLKKYLKNIFISIDQFLNTLVGGDPDETISSRCHKYKNNRFCRFICKVLDKIEKDHCKKSVERDEGRHEVFKLDGDAEG